MEIQLEESSESGQIKMTTIPVPIFSSVSKEKAFSFAPPPKKKEKKRQLFFFFWGGYGGIQRLNSNYFTKCVGE